MKEEADFDVSFRVANFFSDHGGHKHEVVVVNPDQVIILNIAGNGFGKETVDLLVGIPSRFVKGDFTRVIMQKSPEDFIYVLVSAADL